MERKALSRVRNEVKKSRWPLQSRTSIELGNFRYVFFVTDSTSWTIKACGNSVKWPESGQTDWSEQWLIASKGGSSRSATQTLIAVPSPLAK